MAMNPITEVFELVDATDEELYFPLGFFIDLPDAIAQARQFDPHQWENDREEHACCEIRCRRIGLSGDDYTVLWRCEWSEQETEPDSGEFAWVHFSEAQGTTENPLPLCR